MPDWPEPGVLFRDLTPLMADPLAFATAVDLMSVRIGRGTIDEVVGPIEAVTLDDVATLARELFTPPEILAGVGPAKTVSYTHLTLPTLSPV